MHPAPPTAPRRGGRLRALLIAAVLLAGALLRLVSATETRVHEPLAGDATQYFLYAYNLKNFAIFSKDPGDPPFSGRGIRPDAARSPGYPLFLSAFVQGPPDRSLERRVALAQALLGILTLGAAFLLFRLLLPRGWDLAALTFTALSPHLVVMESYILSETLFTLLLVLSGLGLMLLARRPSLPAAALSGALLALGCLVRPSLSFFPLFLAAYLLFRYRNKKAAVRALVLLAAFLLVLAPWSIRNHTLAKSPLGNENLINFLHYGLYPNMCYQDRPETFGWPTLSDPRAAEIHRSVEGVLSEILRRFREEPARHFSWFFLKKPLYFWSWSILRGSGPFVFRVDASPYLSNPVFQISLGLMRVLHWPLVALMALCCFWAWSRGFPGTRDPASRSFARMLSLLLLAYTAMHMVGLPESRYSLPLKPFGYAMAVLCARACYQKISAMRKKAAGQEAP
ncbi:MAG: glycosyltransferase family 39 protein [Thermodesulfobacteriota bacterium]